MNKLTEGGDSRHQAQQLCQHEKLQHNQLTPRMGDKHEGRDSDREIYLQTFILLTFKRLLA